MQPPSRRPAVALLAALCLAAAGCASSAAHPRPAPARPDGGGQVVTAERIAQMNALTAWDVVRRSGFMVSAGNDKQGRAQRLQSRRGRSSVVLGHSDTPLVLLDGVRTHDVRMLERIPAQTVAYVRYLTGIEATVTQGTDAGGGMIELRTRPDAP